MRSVTFTVSSEGFAPFVVVLGSECGPALAEAGPFDLKQVRRCGDCKSPTQNGLCSLLSNCVQVLGFFSRIISSAEVAVRFDDGECSVSFKDTAQRAASLILIYSMIFSRCHFFSRFRFLLKYYPCITSPESLIHLVVTTDLVGRSVLTSEGDAQDPLVSVRLFNNKVRQRLECIFESVQDLPGQDSIRNAFQILHSVNYISGCHTEAFVREMGEGILAIREEDGAIS